MLQGISTTLKYIYLQTYPRFCYVQIAKLARFNNFTTYSSFLPHPSHFLPKPLYTKGKEHVRGAKEPSHIPHITLTPSPPLGHFKNVRVHVRDEVRVHVRDEVRDESLGTSLNKGFLLKNVRDQETSYVLS